MNKPIKIALWNSHNIFANVCQEMKKLRIEWVNAEKLNTSHKMLYYSESNVTYHQNGVRI